MLKFTLFLAALLATTIMGRAIAQAPAPATVAETSKGKTLIDTKGMTLYTFEKDAEGKSACNGPCAQNWPPLVATGDSGPAKWTIISRDDGSKQWAYTGKPLYTRAKDNRPGDTTGDGFNDVWHVAHP